MGPRRLRLASSLLVVAATAVPFARADRAAILAEIEAFFATQDRGRRVEIARRIESDPTYDRARVSEYLHFADLFKPLRPGQHELQVRLHNGRIRQVTLLIPAGYDPHKPWPLIYGLHGAGRSGQQIIGYLRRVLGSDIDKFVVAAPTGYGDLIIHQPEWPPTGEHPAALLEIKKTVHVDSDRVYLTGYSLGGHTSWTLAVLHADQFAAAMPLAGTFTMMLPDLMWESFLPNLAHLPVLCVWGEKDIYYGGDRISPEGGIAGVNRALAKLLEEHKLPTVMIELPGKGHGEVVPPAGELKKLLARRRVHYPKSVEHTFRHVYQAQAYWLEGHRWTGGQWTDKRVTIRLRSGKSQFDDQDFDQAVARTYRGLLGRLRGEIDGQRITVSRRRIKELTLWIGDGMIDWDQPVTLLFGSRVQFEGVLEPSLYLALSQAARTRDFDRLRWAGLRVRSRARTRPVTPETEYPAPLDETPAEK